MSPLARSAALVTVVLSTLLGSAVAPAGGRDRIDGVVKETRTVAGRTYATISVG